MNLLKETMQELKYHKKSIDDIVWIGCEIYEIPKEEFMKLADKEYDAGYGSQEVATDLVVCGEGWWLERHEYDGSEWWEYKKQPKRPKVIKSVKKVIGGMWDTLAELNEEGKE